MRTGIERRNVWANNLSIFARLQTGTLSIYGNLVSNSPGEDPAGGESGVTSAIPTFGPEPSPTQCRSPDGAHESQSPA